MHHSATGFSSWVHRRRSTSLPFPALLFAHENCICPFFPGLPAVALFVRYNPYTPFGVTAIPDTDPIPPVFARGCSRFTRAQLPSKAELSPPSSCTLLLLLLYSSKRSSWCLRPSPPAALILRSGPLLKMLSPGKKKKKNNPKPTLFEFSLPLCNYLF